jgi:hypothetical protein
LEPDAHLREDVVDEAFVARVVRQPLHDIVARLRRGEMNIVVDH